MKKVIFMLIAMFTLAIGANAQEQSNYAGSSSFWDNWRIGALGGVPTNLYDWNAPQGAVAEITLEKDITPIFGLNAEVGMGINNRRNWYSGAEHICNGTAIDQMYAFVGGNVNLTNAILGYKGEPRLFEVETVTNIGYGHGYDNIEDHGTDALLGKAGFNLNFNLGKSKAWQVRIQPSVIYNLSATGQFDCRFATAQLLAGFTYAFGTSNGTHHFAKAKLYDQGEIDRLNARIGELEAQKNKRPERPKPVIQKEVKTVTVTPDSHFGQDKYVIDPTSESVLDDLATEMKNGKDNYTVTGYASVEGDEAYNKTLSQKRADAVKDALVARGVSADRITAVGAGETEKFGSSLEANRRVTIEKK